MINETIKRWQIETIQEMSFQELVSIVRTFSESGITNLFLECVQYEIEARHRAESRIGLVNHS